MVMSGDEIIDNAIDWLNSGSVADPLSSTLRGTDLFAFSDLRKRSGIFPKVHVIQLSDDTSNYFFGAPMSFDRDLVLGFVFYVKQSKQANFTMDGRTLKNEALVRHWLSKTLRDALQADPAAICGISSPRFGEMSAVEADPEQPDIFRGILSIAFSRREV